MCRGCPAPWRGSHHARIRSADLGKVGVTESSSDLGSTAPVLDFLLNFGISAFDNTGDDRMSFACSFQVRDHFADRAARIELTEPLGCVCVCVIRSLELLHIDQHNRNVKVSDCRQHIIACRICQQLHDHKIDIRRAEFVTGSLGLFLGGDHTAVDQFNSVGNTLLECFILRFEFGNELWELGQIRLQCDGEYTDSRFGFN